MIVARMLVRSAMPTEVLNASVHVGSSKMPSYHWSEKPTGGNSISAPEVHDVGTTTSIGSSRNSASRSPSATKGIRPSPRPARSSVFIAPPTAR